MGIVLYIIVRDMIPRGRAGKPLYFLAGVLIIITVSLIFQLV